MYLFILSLLVIWTTSQADAATRYVIPGAGATGCANAAATYNPTTNTCGAGSSTVYTSIANALAANTTVAGDTLSLRAGTYVATIDSNSHTIPSGTSFANAPVIAGYLAETVTIRPNGGAAVVNLAHSYIQYLIFDKIIFDATGADYGIAINNGADHVRFQNGEQFGADFSGVLTVNGSGSSSFNEFINMKFHDNGATRFDHGLYLSTSNNLVDRCEVYNNAGYGVHIYRGDGVADNNVVRNTISRNNSLQDLSQAGILLGSGTGNVAYNNIVYSHPNGIVVGYNAVNALVYNNTVYNQTNYGIDIKVESTGTLVRNNILYLNPTPINNVGGAGTTVSNNSTANPNFVNPSGSPPNFHLQATSTAALDLGFSTAPLTAVVTTDYDGVARPQGSAYDIGAYELATDTTPPTVTGQTPTNGATNVATNTTVTATFSEAMNAATITTSTFTLFAGATPITATVGYSGGTATLTPSSLLAASTTYTATVISGGSGVKDGAGNALATNSTWTFTTAAPSTNPTIIGTPVLAQSGTNATTSLNISATCPSGHSNVMALVCVATHKAVGTAVTVSGVTLGGVPMTPVAAAVDTASNGSYAHLYRLLNPTCDGTSHTAAITLTGGSFFITGSLLYVNNVHQTTPLDTPVTLTGTATNFSIDVPSTPGDLVTDCVSARSSLTDIYWGGARTGDAIETTNGTPTNNAEGAWSYQTAVTSPVTQAWVASANPSPSWAIVGVNVNVFAPPVVTGGAPLRPGQPYAEAAKCAAPGVILCEDFDYPANFTCGADIGGGGQEYAWSNPGWAVVPTGSACAGKSLVTQASVPTQPAGSPSGGYVKRVDPDDGEGQDVGCLWGDCDRATDDSPTGQTYANGLPLSNDLYFRFQIYFSSDYKWPDFDNKIFFMWPNRYVDKPSANIDAGMIFGNGVFCPTFNENFNDALSFRVGSNAGNFKIYPADANTDGYAEHPEYCLGNGYGNNSPDISRVDPPNDTPYPGTVFRFKKATWYTIEFRYKLGSEGVDNGIIEAWVNGTKVYSDSDLETCGDGLGNCAAVQEIVQYFWYNAFQEGGDLAGYGLFDNLIISTAYIGPPSAATPSAPSGLRGGFSVSVEEIFGNKEDL